MKALFRSQSLLRQRVETGLYLFRPSQRAIHGLHVIQDDAGDREALGLKGIYGFRKRPFPKLDKQKVRLWDWNKEIGIKTMAEVREELLGPGRLLSWRPNKHHRAGEGRKYPGGIRDYEIISMATINDKRSHPVRELWRASGVHVVRLRSGGLLTDSMTQRELARAYNLLDSTREGPRIPVRFNLSYAPINEHCSVLWAVKNRVDLHPEAILSAMPDGTQIATFPRLHPLKNRLVWTCVPKDFTTGAVLRESGELEVV